MHTKLTLSIDKAVINKAKLYARKREKSLSLIVEEYLNIISSSESLNMPGKIPPVTASLAGILKGKEDFDIRASITDYLVNKYK